MTTMSFRGLRAALQAGQPVGSICFVSRRATPLDASNVRRAFAKVLKSAELPPHFTPHCLRHTYASLLLQNGESPVYVQRQLGHASIQLTVDTYGKWLPMGNKAAVDRLDQTGARTTSERSGSKMLAERGQRDGRAAQVPEKKSGPRRTRTFDPLIKSTRSRRHYLTTICTLCDAKPP